MKPKLRELEIHPIQHQGQDMLYLRDRLALSDIQIAIPRPLAPLLGWMDGMRDEGELEAALQVRAGVRLAPGLLSELLSSLDDAYLLDNERSSAARDKVLRDYLAAPSRPVTVLDSSHPDASPEGLAALMQGYVDGLAPAEKDANNGLIRGLVCPHIDYRRGGPVYAEVWRAAEKAAREAKLVIVFGTDHQGREGALTLTRQSYSTPWGILPTEREAVEDLAAALGEDAVFGEELHHRDEHSIELAAMWLHFVRGGEPVAMVPILCGSFGDFVAGASDPADYAPFALALEVLEKAMAQRNTLVVAAADLAHVGPAFGDPYGLDYVGKAQLRDADERLLQSVFAGDEAAFFGQLQAEGNRRNVCGLPPMYLTLRLLEGCTGTPAGYDLCPADPQGLSFVTIAGVVLTNDPGRS